MTLHHSAIHSRTWMQMSTCKWRHSDPAQNTFPFPFPQIALPWYKNKYPFICRWKKRNLRMSCGSGHRWRPQLDDRDEPTLLRSLSCVSDGFHIRAAVDRPVGHVGSAETENTGFFVYIFHSLHYDSVATTWPTKAQTSELQQCFQRLIKTLFRTLH